MTNIFQAQLLFPTQNSSDSDTRDVSYAV